MSKKYKIVSSIIKVVFSAVIIISVLLIIIYKSLFANKTEEPKVETETKKPTGVGLKQADK